ncbi:MAG: ATP-binding cassette domain-containing protein [Bifidobacteriaceae bacterium]|nr:ATP-binding cassette domain-containing protein [Bifidobacteriaceae bacterium]
MNQATTIPNPLVLASHLSVNLGGQTILHDITTQLTPGETVGLLGANGSGKSTLVRTLLGLIAPSQGRVELFGQPPGRQVPWHRLAYVPQDSPAGAGVPTSALEAVMAGLLSGPWPWPPRGAKERALRALDQVGLRQQARSPLKVLSGGQRHRVLLARALVRRPELLIMDEPLAGVDGASATALVDALREIPCLTCLVVLHEAGPFAGYLKRGIVLRSGRLVADAPLTKLAPEAISHHHDAPPLARPGVQLEGPT